MTQSKLQEPIYIPTVLDCMHDIDIWLIETQDSTYFKCCKTPLMGFRYVLSGNVTFEMSNGEVFHAKHNDLIIFNSTSCAIKYVNSHVTQGLKIFGIDIYPYNQTENLSYLEKFIIESNFCKIDAKAIIYFDVQEPFPSLALQAFASPLKGIQHKIYLQGIVYQFIALLSEFYQYTNDSSSVIVSACDAKRIDCVKCILRNECKQPPPVEILAKNVGISRKRLSKLFKTHCGIGINDYLQEHRLVMAYHLLTHTKLHISEIAYQVGYTPAYLSTAFKKRYGFVPKSIRVQA